MNTSTTPTQFEVSFIHEDRRVQARGALTAEQQKAVGELLVDRPQALSLMHVPEGSNAGSAEELVDTITDAIGLDDDEDNSAWDRVRELAVGIDRMVVECPAPKTLLVEFIWNNGGGDDNLFGQNFQADGAGPDNERLVDQFIEALELAGADSFYDLGVQVSNGDEQYMTITDLVEWIEENNEGDEGLSALGAVLEDKPAAAPRSPGMR